MRGAFSLSFISTWQKRGGVMKGKSIKKTIEIALISVLLLLILVFLLLFINQYKTLGDTIDKERITYVSEIKNQLVDNINTEKKLQTTALHLYSHTILKSNPNSFSDLEDLLNDSRIDEGDRIFLVAEDGALYTLDGIRQNLSDNKLIQALLAEGESVFAYGQINNADEYWFYGELTEEIILDGISVQAILSARSIQNFGAHMTTSILNNEGFTYVTTKNGNVRIFPHYENDMGYNLFNSLKGNGASAESVEKMRTDFEQGRDGQEFLSYGGDRWLVSYSGGIFDDWVVVVLMPMTITAADTYRMLNHTMLAVALLVGSILALMLFLINLFYRRERVREQAVQQERLRLEVINRTAESKNQFLAKMSHDIRTPLNAIMGLLKIAEGLVADQPKVEDNLGKIRQSAEYLLSILNDILDMSKIESGKMQIDCAPFSLTKMLSAIEAMNMTQADNKNLDFQVEVLGDPSPCYMGDQLRLNQVLMNLLSNAIKFTPEGGSVRLSVTTAPCTETVDALTFVVEDTGIGMSEEYLQNLFQPFEQESASVALNYAGSGLGLSIVKNLVDLMGGEIRVDSVKGQGSRFEISLSLSRAEPSDAVSAQENEPPPLSLKGRKLLLAEDNEINAMIASELIGAHCGMLVDTAENGQLALERFLASGTEEYAAILMDIRMPVMDGLAAARAIRASSHPRAGQIPIIAMSANAFQEDVALSLESGMNGHLSKPIDIDKLDKELKLWIWREEKR